MDRNIKDVYGLTPSQEGIYAQYFRNADTKTYHLQSLCKIKKETAIIKLPPKGIRFLLFSWLSPDLWESPVL